MFHARAGVFADLASPIVACRYHSLVVERETLPDCLVPTAWTADGTIMAIEHRELPIVGLQFHPESILTEVGYPLLAAFLRRAGIETPDELPAISRERAEPPAVESRLPSVPVTF